MSVEHFKTTTYSGTVKKWFADKGFGFIKPDDGSDDLFTHFKQINGMGERRTTLNIGENVTYTIGTNVISGKPIAENVVGDKTGNPSPASTRGKGRGGRGAMAFYGAGGRGYGFGFAGYGAGFYGAGVFPGMAGMGRGRWNPYGAAGMMPGGWGMLGMPGAQAAGWGAHPGLTAGAAALTPGTMLATPGLAGAGLAGAGLAGAGVAGTTLAGVAGTTVAGAAGATVAGAAVGSPSLVPGQPTIGTAGIAGYPPSAALQTPGSVAGQVGW